MAVYGGVPHERGNHRQGSTGEWWIYRSGDNLNCSAYKPLLARLAICLCLAAPNLLGYTPTVALRKSGSVPTISDVAKAVGVSRSTVSRVFSQPQLISDETTRRVRTAATKLGYKPNLIARALSTGRQGNIAIVVHDIANPFFPPLLRAAQASAESSGLSIFLGNSDEDPVREQKLIDRLVMKVEGFVLASPRISDEKIQELANRTPVVLVNRDIVGIPRVLIDTASGIDAAVAHLAKLHHKCLVYVSGPAASWSDQQRRMAMRRASAHYKVRVEWVAAHQPTFDAGKEATATVLALNATAAVTFDDFVAHGLLAGLAERSIVVPRDFSVIGCDDVLGAMTHPALTSVAARCDEAGRMAVDLLVNTLRRGSNLDARCVIDTNLVIRATTAPRRSKR
jgi:DNA-binding LacI/PurR family transcriptional regulator